MSLACVLAATILAAVSAAGIRTVDFNNFTYPADLLNGSGARGTLTLRNGTFAFEDKANYVKVECGHRKVVYGDLTGDGQDEAVVTLWCSTGGTGFFTEAYVYAMQNGHAKLLTSLAGGDRGDQGIYRVSIANQQLMIVRGDVTEGVCCPDRFTETAYKWNGKSFVVQGVRRFSGNSEDFQ